MQMGTGSLWWRLQRAKHRKRRELNKQSMEILVDKVTLFYLIPFLIIGLLVVRDLLQAHNELLTAVVNDLSANVIVISFLTIQLGLFQKKPVFGYSSSEQLLIHLPHQRKVILRYFWLLKGGTLLIVHAVVFALLYLLLPLPLTTALAFFFWVSLFRGLMLIIRWSIFCWHGVRGYIFRFLASGAIIIAVIALSISTGIDRINLIGLILLTLMSAQVIGFFMIEAVSDFDRVVAMNDHFQFRTFFVKAVVGKVLPLETPKFPRLSLRNKARAKPAPMGKTSHLYRRVMWSEAVKEQALILQTYFSVLGLIVFLSTQGFIFLRMGLVLGLVLHARLFSLLFRLMYQAPLLKSIPLRIKRYVVPYQFVMNLITLAVVAVGLAMMQLMYQVELIDGVMILIVAYVFTNEWLRYRVEESLNKQKPLSTTMIFSILWLIGYIIVYRYHTIIAGFAGVVWISYIWDSLKMKRGASE